MEIQGSNAIMVGGASGMCLATAEKFVERGGKVAILDLEKSDGAAVAERLGGHFFPCNVMDYAGMETVIGEAAAALGSVQFCVNTAGGGVAKRTIAKDGSMHPLEDFQRIIDLNLIASFNVNRVVASHMAKNEPNEVGERGVMINTASIAAFEGQIGQVAYTAAKAGIAGMTPNHGSGPRHHRRARHDHCAQPLRHGPHGGHPLRGRASAHQRCRLPQAHGAAARIRHHGHRHL